jgi:hypothetical protein
VSRLSALARFLWDFIVGDDWRIALAVVVALVDRSRQLAARDVGDGDLFDDTAQRGPHGDPDLRQRLRGAVVLRLFGRRPAHRRERAFDRTDDVGDGHGRCVVRESEAAFGAAMGAHKPGVT